MVSSLVEPGMKYFLSCSLKHCKEYKSKQFNLILNILLTLIICGIILTILYYARHYKKTHVVDYNKQNEYVLSLIKNYQLERQKERNELITNLPFDTSVLI